jgi:hypothetical protein
LVAFVVLAVGATGDAAELPDTLRRREHALRERPPLDRIAFAGAWGEPALG